MKLAHDLAMALDPARLMIDAGMTPDQWQREVLHSTAMRILLLCARQTGKSTVTAALATHTAQYEPSSLVLIGAPSQAQSTETFRKVTTFYERVGSLDPEAESTQRLELPSGSRIVSLSGNADTCRGYSSPRLVILDEGAFISDDFYHAVTPMLAGGGRLIAMSTPFGKRGWFWDAWENGGDVWHRVQVTADDVPHRITPAFLATERSSKPEWRVLQEYYCQFVDTDEQLFGSDLIASAITANVRPILSQPFVW